jgi:hypothetical protein
MPIYDAQSIPEKVYSSTKDPEVEMETARGRSEAYIGETASDPTAREGYRISHVQQRTRPL